MLEAFTRCIYQLTFVVIFKARSDKKASKGIHIGMEHKKILDILDEELGKNGYLKNENEEFFEDEVTLENLGLVCKICAFTET